VRRFLYQATVTGLTLSVVIPMAVVSVAAVSVMPAASRRFWRAFWASDCGGLR